MRCLNCKRDQLAKTVDVCSGCGVHLPTLLREVLPHGTALDGGKYRVDYALDWGGFGITYLATHITLKQPVAVKEFYPREHVLRNGTTGQVTITTSPESFGRALRRFVREGETLARIDHPNVVRVRDQFEERGTAYLVMDYIAPARTLRAELDAAPGRRLQPSRVEAIVGQLVGALEAVHGEGVYHLDISPDNVLLTASGRAVLVDFGAARRGISTKTTQAFKLEYAAPEVVAGKQVGPESDLFELGMMTHEMLTGRRPPPALSRLLGGDWEPDGFAEPWRSRLAAALRLKQAERPASASQWWKINARAGGDASPPGDKAPQAKPPTSSGRERRRNERADVPVVRCPECGANTGRGAQQCSQCGARLEARGDVFLPPGTTLSGGTYRVGRAVMYSRRSITYLAEHVARGEAVRVKEFFPPELASREPGRVAVLATSPSKRGDYIAELSRFIRAGRMLASLSHPGVVPVRQTFEENGTSYLVMGALEGRTLRDELDAAPGGRLAASLVAQVMGEIVSVLEHCHKKSLYHLDLTPENVLLTGVGRPVLTGFVGGRVVTGAGVRWLWSRYSPPELADGGEVGAGSDVYGLGLLLYEMLTGRVPPSGVGRSKSFWSLADVGEKWEALVVAATRPLRSERPDSVRGWWEGKVEPPRPVADKKPVPVTPAAPKAPKAKQVKPASNRWEERRLGLQLYKLRERHTRLTRLRTLTIIYGCCIAAGSGLTMFTGSHVVFVAALVLLALLGSVVALHGIACKVWTSLLFSLLAPGVAVFVALMQFLYGTGAPGVGERGNEVRQAFVWLLTKWEVSVAATLFLGVLALYRMFLSQNRTERELFLAEEKLKKLKEP